MQPIMFPLFCRNAKTQQKTKLPDQMHNNGGRSPTANTSNESGKRIFWGKGEFQKNVFASFLKSDKMRPAKIYFKINFEETR